MQAERTLTGLSLPPSVGVSSWEGEHNLHVGSGLQEYMYSLFPAPVGVVTLSSRRPGAPPRKEEAGKRFWEAGPSEHYMG